MPSPMGTAVPPEVGARQTRSFHSNTKNDPSDDTDGFIARYMRDQSRAGASSARTPEASAAALDESATTESAIANMRISAIVDRLYHLFRLMAMGFVQFDDRRYRPL